MARENVQTANLPI